MTTVETAENTIRARFRAGRRPDDLVLVVVGAERTDPLPLDGRPVRLGRAGESDLVLADRYVSLEHCVVEPFASGHLVRDLGSRNGTYLNGARIREAMLEPGARLVLGREVVLCLRRGPSPGAFTGPGELVGRSQAMRRLAAELSRYSSRQSPVLLQGETGTGKELAARAIHDLSSRRAGPFVALNCGALSPELAMSELLGHERGAFTGAESRHAGAFEQAHGGTLFLDEVGELHPRVQAALLRVLETRRVRRVGGGAEQDVEVRVVAATNRDLAAAVGAELFREDLFHRLAVLVVRIPPLRERLEDIPDLSRALLARMGDQHELTDGALEDLGLHDWPGNVRELRNVLERAVALARDPAIGPGELRLDDEAGAASPARPRSLLALVAEHGTVAAAARAAGLPRTTVRDRVRRARRQSGARAS